jgi:hypothetical protein
MSYHIRLKNYSCESCRENYIPYESNLPCPWCSYVPQAVDTEYLDFISGLIQSLRTHIYQYNRYHPGAWYQGSFAEAIQGDIFQLFEMISQKKIEDDVGLSTMFNSIKWGDEKYVNYLMSITRKLFQVYKSDPTLRKKNIILEKFNIFKFIIGLLKGGK